MIFTLGNYTIDSDTHELLRDDLPQKLEPLIFKLLLYMLKNSDRVLSRDELIKGIWKSHVISDSSLNAAISAARYAIGDSGSKQQCIKTVSGSGYRFIATFKSNENVKATPSTSLITTKNPERSLKSIDPPDQPSIAVMDFIDINTQNQQSLLATGLTSDINSSLARQPHFFVIARASAHHISKMDLPANDVGRYLGVRYLVYANVRQVAKCIRVTLSVVDAMDNAEIWSEHFDRNFDNFFSIQDEITNSILVAIESAVEQSEINRSFLIPTENLSAWENYHRGVWHIDRTNFKDAEHAQLFFKKAIKQDKRFSRAYAGLSYIHTNRRLLDHSTIGASDHDIMTSMDYAQRSIDLCITEPNGYISLGRALLFSNKVPQALEMIKRALELSPNSAVSHLLSSLCAIKSGKLELSLESLEKAERLNLHSNTSLFSIYMTRSMLMLDMEKYKDASYFSAIAIQHNNNYFMIYALAAACHQLANKKQKAMQYATLAIQLLPDCTVDSCQRIMSYSKKHRELFTKALIDAGIPKTG